MLLRKRAPKNAAVTIDRPAEGGSLAAAMKMVAGRINLETIGVKVLTTRRTRAGGNLLEVEGTDKADLLAEKIRAVAGEAARVRQPVVRTPVLILGISEWVEAEDVVSDLVNMGIPGVLPDDLKIWRNTGGRAERVASLSLPLEHAITLAEHKTVIVGWTKVRVKLLEKSHPTCYRCQQKGHLAAECRNEPRARRCHRCQSDDHTLKDCIQPSQSKQQQEQPARKPLRQLQQPTIPTQGIVGAGNPAEAELMNKQND